jgi:hypothetical protein
MSSPAWWIRQRGAGLARCHAGRREIGALADPLRCAGRCVTRRAGRCDRARSRPDQRGPGATSWDVAWLRSSPASQWANSSRWFCSRARSTVGSTNRLHATPIRHSRSRRRRTACSRPATREGHWTKPSPRPAHTAIKPWSLPAASTTPHQPVRRPTSPASRVPDPKPEQLMNFSPKRNENLTTRLPIVITGSRCSTRNSTRLHPSVGRAAPQLNPPLLSRPREQGHDLCGRDESAELSAGDELPDCHRSLS